MLEATSSEEEAAAEVEVGSSEADSVGSGAKTPVLIDEVDSAEADSEAEADSTPEADAEADADSMAEIEVDALALTLAEGRVHALFLATGDPNAGAAKARTGRMVKIVANFIFV